MTTETIVSRADLEKAVAEAQAEAANALKAFQTYMGENGVNADLGETQKLSQAAVTAKNKVERAENAIKEFDSNERWKALAQVNAGIIKSLNDRVKAGLPQASIIGMTGTVTISDAGEISADVKLQIEPINTDTLKAQIVEHVSKNLDSYKEHEVKGLQFSATNLGKDDQDISIRPMGAGSKPRVSSGASTGEGRARIEYNLNGSWVGPRDLIAGLRSRYEDDHAKAFATILDQGSNNGVSNLAKTLAAKAGVESRTKAAE